MDPTATAERIEAPALAALPGIAHGFFTRRGGVSTGAYASLNCALLSGDDRAAVLENRARVAAALGVDPARLISPRQVHGTGVAVASTPWPPGEGADADAVVTTERGLAIGVGTADCAPVLLADEAAGVIGAAHAGWRGAADGVLAATVEAMERLGAARKHIRAAIGPTIAQDSYEVGPDLLDRFAALDPGAARWFRPSPNAGRHLFDLPGFLFDRLCGMGLGGVENLRLDTYADAGRFFSHRRGTHAGAPDYGRMISAIALR
ncbi:MAG: peptidoglycan editing factor PgeF [Bauldia sp.]|nr:peptidoglycan editing factor PgeF [Bauldia sp.]